MEINLENNLTRLAPANQHPICTLQKSKQNYLSNSHNEWNKFGYRGLQNNNNNNFKKTRPYHPQRSQRPVLQDQEHSVPLDALSHKRAPFLSWAHCSESSDNAVQFLGHLKYACHSTLFRPQRLTFYCTACKYPIRTHINFSPIYNPSFIAWKYRRTYVVIFIFN